MSNTIKVYTLIVVALLVLSGCAKASPPYTVSFQTEAMTFEQKEMVYDAMQNWNTALGRQAFTLSDSYDADACDQVRIFLKDGVDLNEDGKPDPNVVGGSFGKGCNYRLDLTDFAMGDPATLEHEFGHTLGLDDLGEDHTDSVMYHASVRFRAVITAEDVAKVKEIWGW